MVDRARLRQRLDKATRRPWRVTSGVVPSIDKVERVIVEAVHRSTERGGYVVANCGPVGEHGSSNDADLIVALVNEAPSLLDELDACDQATLAIDDLIEVIQQQSAALEWARERLSSEDRVALDVLARVA